MAGNPYLVDSGSGYPTTVHATQTSAGAGSAGVIIGANSSGLLDATWLPPGIGPDIVTVTASEALSAGAFVNIYNNTGTPAVRNANATSNGKECHGFVLAAFSSSASATVYLNGLNNQLTSLLAGDLWLGTTAGVGTATSPSAAGNVVQKLGVAVSATSMWFTMMPYYVLG